MNYFKKLVKSTFVLGLLFLQSAAFAMQSTTVDVQPQPTIESTQNSTVPADKQQNLGTTFFGKIRSALFSFEGQLITCATLFNPFATDAFNNAPSGKTLSSVPSPIEDACRKMSFELDPNKIIISPEVSHACAHKSVIYLGDKFLENHSPKQAEFVVGHEIAHLQLNHAIKRTLSTALLTLSPVLFAAFIKIIEIKYAPKPGTTLYKLIELSKKLNKSIIENPFLWFFIVKFGYGALSRYQEQQADLLAAEKTGQIEGGISFFEKYLPKEQAKYSWFNPINLFSKANSILFGLHPSPEDRIEYLKALQK